MFDRQQGAWGSVSGGVKRIRGSGGVATVNKSGAEYAFASLDGPWSLALCRGRLQAAGVPGASEPIGSPAQAGRQACSLQVIVDQRANLVLVSRRKIWGHGMSVQIEPEIHWDGRTLVGWVLVDGRRTMLCATREMIHGLSMYNDAIGWEIERYKSDIFERLIPQLLSAASR